MRNGREDIVADEKGVFEAARYLTRVNGNDYLEVKWRLVWLRDRHPDAQIATQVHSLTDQRAVILCDISIPGGGSASGVGSETPGDFRDYIEKAETKAIGRALAALGFGTQFCDDHQFGAEQGRVVDSPVAARGNGNGASLTQRVKQERPSAAQAASRPVQTASGKSATGKQLGFLRALAKEFGWDDATLHAEAGVKSLNDLDISAASALIDEWSSRTKPAQQPIAQERQKGWEQTAPEEPEWLRAAPDPAMAGQNKWSN